MRVIGGEYRRRRLNGAPGESKHLRPTSDRVRESLFNLLGRRVADADFLDLFSGTGAVGIEALSRGAKRTVFVENSDVCLRVLRGNVESLDLGARCEIARMDVTAWVASASRAGKKFDVIFADPPYDAGFLPGLLDALGGGELLKSNTIVALEQRMDPWTREAGSLVMTDDRKYGKTRITLWTPAILEKTQE
jgi:16S rRNA (guanine966-N2)-methyltransferase